MNLSNRNLKRIFPSLSCWMIFFLGFFVTIILTYREYKTLQKQKKEVFELDIANIQKNIKSRLDQDENVLMQAKAYFLNSRDVTKEKFSKYVKDSLLLKKYSGLLGIGYSVRVASSDLASNITKIRKTTIKDFKIWPKTPREDYYEIVYLEPLLEQSRNVIGYDISTEPTRREAMNRARDSGQVALTRKAYLLQSYETKNQREVGLLLFCPIYKHGSAIETVEERRKNLQSFIFSVFVPQKLFNSIFATTNFQIDFEIYDGPEMNAQNLLYDNDGRPHYLQTKSLPDFEGIRVLKINGQEFTLYASSSPRFQQEKRLSHLWVFMGGIILTILLTWIVVVSKGQEEVSRSKVEELQIAEKNLLATQMALKEAIQTRDEFISIASHELKNPMTSLKLHTQLLQRQLKNAQDLNEYRARIEKALVLVNHQVSSLNRLVEDMLDISRLRTGKLKIITTETDLAEIIYGSVTALSESLRAEGYPDIKVDILGSLKGVWDKMRLEQVINNLLTNAIRYGNKKAITIKAIELEETIKVSFCDQGIGISKANQKKIFDRFERATSSNEDGGLGLGLFITLNIIEAHQGKIWVDSEEGKGAVFTFEIPKTLK